MSPILGIFASANQSQFISTTSYESIATQTVGAGGAATVTFSSIPQTFKHLQIRGIARGTSTSTYDRVDYRFNSDSGTNYARHLILAGGISTPESYGYTGQTFGAAAYVSGATLNSAVFGAVVIDILDYTNTSKYKTVKSIGGADGNGSQTYMNLASAVWQSTSAITSITIGPIEAATNLAQYSSFALYGIKG